MSKKVNFIVNELIIALQEAERNSEKTFISDTLFDMLRPYVKVNEDSAVIAPKHYTHGGVEPLDYIESKGYGFCVGNAIKYIARAGHKDNIVQDLKKARFYLIRQMNRDVPPAVSSSQFIMAKGLTPNLANAILSIDMYQYDEAVEYLTREIKDLMYDRK